MIRWRRAAIALVLTLGLTPAAIGLTQRSAIAQVYGPENRGEAIERIQLRLGLFPDGIYGSQTESAVRDFQQRNGLQVDGFAGPETLRALGLEDLIAGTDYYNPGNPSSGSSASYVVVVPGSSTTLLNQVRRFQPGASLARSHRGSYIRAAAFAQRSSAEQVSRQLRDSGLDARVAYRPATTVR